MVGFSPIIRFGCAVARIKARNCLNVLIQRDSYMTFSFLHRWKEPTTQCCICGCSVTLELSKTDEEGKAVHEFCYVRRTLLEFGEPVDEAPQPRSVNPNDRAGIASEPPLNGMHWRIFGLLRL